MKGRRLLPALLVLAGLLLLGAGTVYWRIAEDIARPAAAPLPASLAGQPLAQALYGAEAVAEISHLHGQSFPLVSAGEGMYGRNSHPITLWVSGTPARPLARRMVAEMEAAIAQGNSPFTPLGLRQENGQAVYELSGMGQRHFYWQASTEVVWLAADESLAETALAEALNFYALSGKTTSP